MTERRVALVTGSGKKRVGNRVAEALAARDFALVVHYSSSATEAGETVGEIARAHGVPVHAIRADLANENEVKTMVAEALAKFGRVDALVNCVAIWKRKRLEEVTAADLQAHFETNTLDFLNLPARWLAMVTLRRLHRECRRLGGRATLSGLRRVFSQ